MARPLPSVDSLRCFVAAADQLNFRRAAAEVALTPAALSQRIKQLEDQLGVVLFDRDSRHVVLTPAGVALLERARPALAAIAACAEVGDAAPARLRLSLATRFELGLSFVVPAIAALRRERPQWHIDLVFGSGPEIVAQLERGAVDAVLTSAPTADADWTSEVVHPEHYALVAAPALLQRQRFDAPEHGRDHCLLDIDGSLPLARYALSVCPGLEFGAVWRVGTGAAVHQLACAGEGVAVLPLHMIAQDLEHGRLVRLLPALELLDDSFRLIYRGASPLRAELSAIAAWLRAWPLA
ncbi:MAG: LysR family transcriptional regulator [Nannocystaceae bacterium]|nr:LysR family transcriptional regulator [Nannocystaceae bacterium]